MAAVLAHGLALIRRDILGLPGPDPDRCAAAGLYHDASEILTGDLPTPVKYFNPEIKKAYKQVERVSGRAEGRKPGIRICGQANHAGHGGYGPAGAGLLSSGVSPGL